MRKGQGVCIRTVKRFERGREYHQSGNGRRVLLQLKIAQDGQEVVAVVCCLWWFWGVNEGGFEVQVIRADDGGEDRAKRRAELRPPLLCEPRGGEACTSRRWLVMRPVEEIRLVLTDTGGLKGSLGALVRQSAEWGLSGDPAAPTQLSEAP